MSDATDSSPAEQLPVSDDQWPEHDRARVWFLTDGRSPIAVALARRLLEHGDAVVAGLTRSITGIPVDDELAILQAEWQERSTEDRLKAIAFDHRSAGECQAAVSTAIQFFGRLDVLLCCHSEALIGTIEEVTQSAGTESLIADQFESNYFGPVNIIKATLPYFRQQSDGHVILLSGITGHLGTPGLGMFCASQWAMEGYCDSLAYEVAPFDIRMSIVQSTIEVCILTSRIIAAPGMDAYANPENAAPLARQLWGRILDRLHEFEMSDMMHAASVPPSWSEASRARNCGRKKPSEVLNSDGFIQLYPHLPAHFKEILIAETVHALTAIGGHANPPARHIVGFEGIASVREKLRTVSEELEDFYEVSVAVDLPT